jgi:ketosteroid isomerase-like protein
MENAANSRYGSAVFLLTLFAAQTGCAPPPPRDSRDADIRTIREGEILWVRHWGTRDAERIVAHYAEAAALMLPDMPPAIGREAIREMVGKMVQDANLALSFEPLRVDAAKSGDLGFSQGAYQLTTTDPATKRPFTDKGAYITIYRKQLDGSWKAEQSIFTSSLPASLPAGPR